MWPVCRRADDVGAYGYEGQMKNGALGPVFIDSLAEEAGFEPAVGFTLRTLSRRVT